MEEPDWAKVLHAIYRSNNGEIVWPREDDTMDKTIDGTDLNQDEEDDAISYLHKIGLIEHADRDRGRPRLLTEKGFNVVHERELRKEQHALVKSQNDAIENQSEATDTLANFTIILGVTALIQALAAIVSLPRYRIPLSVIYAGLLLILLYKKDDWFHGG
ncbi:hypothetical protein [Haloarcula marina]|uniref:hypothetical protein n=1 Tax=Haloarcula marina TaxID=2961574 RepID=UPI0020B8BDA4|nr:hypothetical protein [Halomicroarcula marina]